MKLNQIGIRRLILAILVGMVTASCDKVSDVASGAGSATKNLANKITGENDSSQIDEEVQDGTISQSAAGTIGEPDSSDERSDDDDPEVEPDADVQEKRNGNFNLIFEMTYQSCASCGIWFDSAELIIEHSEGTFSARQSGSLLIKEAPYHQGRFSADMSSVSPSSTIDSAILYMHLNRHEGISNDDYTSTIAVYSEIDGSTSYVRDITAKDDIKGRGYSKANPVVPIDFTEYARRLD